MELIDAYLIAFTIIILLGIITTIAAYNKCKEFNLKPPGFYTQIHQLEFLWYLKTESRKKEFSVLKVYFNISVGLCCTAVVLVVAGFIFT